MINSKIISSIFLIFSGNAKGRIISFGRLLSSHETKAITGGNEGEQEGAAPEPEPEDIVTPL